jgi:transposase
MYVRKIKSRNSTCFQIVKKSNGKVVLIKHIGCAINPEEIEALQQKAKFECENLKFESQLSLFPTFKSDLKAILSNWRITGFHQVFGTVYDSIGFPNNAFRDLTVARIVYPKSKLATSRYLDQYIGITISEDKIYRFLDTLQKDEVTRIAFDFVSKKNNGIALIFYDVTTLYFEADEEDDLRKRGYSKDHKNELPQIVFGIFVDKDGYPFDFDFYEGNTFEGHTFPKAIKALIAKYQFDDLVVVADAGMLSEKNISYLETENLSYIVGARLKVMAAEIKKQIFAHDFMINPTMDIVCTSKEKESEKKRLIVNYSEKRAKKDSYNRDKLIKSLEVKLASKKEVIRKSKYLLIENKGDIVGIDNDKIEQDRRHDGLKGYWTNLKAEINPTDIIEQYNNLWKVEKAFRMSKSDLQERPIFHRKLNRIRGHLLLCFCSLLVMKETERLLKPIEISLTKAIEILGKVGVGEMALGKIKMPIESELDPKVKSILNQILGH